MLGPIEANLPQPEPVQTSSNPKHINPFTSCEWSMKSMLRTIEVYAVFQVSKALYFMCSFHLKMKGF